MELGVNIEQFSREQLLELVKLLIAENEKLRAEIALLKAEIEQLKRQRSATPFSKNEPQKNSKRPGPKRGKGIFRNRTAPAEEDYSEPLIEVPVADCLHRLRRPIELL